jgi:hypothetical protein
VPLSLLSIKNWFFFWYKIDREVFGRSGAPFVSTNIKEKYETHPDYKLVNTEHSVLKGSN